MCLQGQAIPLSNALNEQIVMVPVLSNGERAELETTIFKPSGNGPFPLLLMNHGKALGDPHAQPRDRFLAVSREFVSHGYAVAIPMRKGFAGSSGRYRETSCDMAANGLAQASDALGALRYLLNQPWVDREHIVVGGQSYGGLAAMALGTRDVPGVRGLLNFAGGLKVHGGDCQWQASLVNAFTEYGRHTHVPSLWFYGSNDSHFDPELADQMHSAYLAAGGHARLVKFGPFKNDAHTLSGSHDGVRIWWPETEKFLAEVGMPAAAAVTLAEDWRYPKSDFAELANVDAVPFLQDGGRQAYRTFLAKGMPRAFAIAPSGAWSWAEDGDDPVDQVLMSCERRAGQPCRLYAVNDAVVWPGTAKLAGTEPSTGPAAPTGSTIAGSALAGQSAGK
jgi:dienelactone hydrolase